MFSEVIVQCLHAHQWCMNVPDTSTLKVLQSGGCEWHLTVSDFSVPDGLDGGAPFNVFSGHLCFLFCEMPVLSFAHFYCYFVF